MIAGATVVGTGFTGASNATAGEMGRSVDIAATGPYLPAVRNVVETYEGPPVDVHPLVGVDQQPAVRISGRPTEGADTAHAVMIQGWGALSHTPGEWRECECRSDIRGHWASDDPVETWSESDWTSVAALDDRTAAAVRLDGVATMFVRGTRSYQYASGQGGVGYYDIDSTELTSFPVHEDDHTPVARLAYLHVDEEALSNEQISAFLHHYDRQTGDIDDLSAGFVDPAVGN